MAYYSGDKDVRRPDTSDGKLAVLKRFFDDTIEAASPTPWPYSPRPAGSGDLSTNVSNRYERSRPEQSSIAPSLGHSQVSDDSFDAEKLDVEPLWSPPLTSPALTEATLTDENTHEGLDRRQRHIEPTLYRKEELQRLSLASARRPLGLPASPRPDQRPTLTTSRTYLAPSSLNPQIDQTARRRSDSCHACGSQRYQNVWLSPSCHSPGPRSAPLTHQAFEAHQTSAIRPSNDTRSPIQSYPHVRPAYLTCGETERRPAATTTYKVTQIQPSYPDFQLSTPTESEFEFPPPTPVEVRPQVARPSESPLLEYQRHAKEGQDSRSLFKRISPTFGHFFRIGSNDRSAPAPTSPRRGDKLLDLQSYFRSSANGSRRRGARLENIETEFPNLVISSPMGSGNDVPHSAVPHSALPESGSSADTDKFWW